MECVGDVAKNWIGLERASAGILEEVVGERKDSCEFCGQGHGNGDCELPKLGVVELDLRGLQA